MTFTKIYLEGDDSFINEILEIAREKLGDGCSIIDLLPNIVKDEEESE